MVKSESQTKGKKVAKQSPIKFSIILDNFWDNAYEDDCSLQRRVQDALVSGIQRNVISKVGEEARNSLSEKLHTYIDKNFEPLLLSRIQKNMVRGSFFAKINYDKKEVNIDHFIQEKIKSFVDTRAFEENIEKLFEKAWNKVEQRYDANFAATVIKKLDEGGFLKDGIKSLLLEDRSKQEEKHEDEQVHKKKQDEKQEDLSDDLPF